MYPFIILLMNQIHHSFLSKSLSHCFFQISGRLFSDSGPRRSTRLAGEAGNANPSGTTVAGNGTSHSSKYLGGGKLSSAAFRSVTVRKGQSLANESFDEGDVSPLPNVLLVRSSTSKCFCFRSSF